MIRLLGTKRIIIIVVCILFSAAAGAGWYYYLDPEKQRLDREIRTVNGKIFAKEAEIKELKLEYDKLKDQIVGFNLLKKQGFFGAQDRVTARETIRELARQAKLQRVELKLTPARIVDSKEATAASHSLLSGPMTLKIRALDDVHVYKFIIALQRVFPGYLEFNDLLLERKTELTDEVIKNLSEGNSDGLIEGDVSFNWWTMASPEQLGANPYFNPAAQAPEATSASGNKRQR